MILEALGANESEPRFPMGMSVREIAAVILADKPRPLPWVGTDPESMTHTLNRLLVHGYVERREFIRLRKAHAKWRWWITDSGWDALMAWYDAQGL
jgi:hypothetical protein